MLNGEERWHAAEPRPQCSGIIMAHFAGATESGNLEFWHRRERERERERARDYNVALADAKVRFAPRPPSVDGGEN